MKKQQGQELPGEKIKVKRIAITVIGVAIMLLVILCAVHFVRSLQEFQIIPRALEINECTPSGYLQEGNSFINTAGDANIQLPELNQFVTCVSVKFAMPIDQPLNITLYYAEADHGYSEKYTASENIDQGADSAVLFVGKNITTCRIDIGTLVGEEFVLESISINDELLIHSTDYIECYKVFVLFLLAICVAVAILALLIYKMKKELSNTQRIVTIIVVTVLVLLAMSRTVHFAQFMQKNRCIANNIEISECIPYGYTQEENRFINTVGDANIQLPELNQYVAGVLIKFADPIEQPLNVKLYYAEADHGYSEKYTVITNMNEGADSTTLFIGEDITTCRIDIGTLEGEEFVLESIVLNDEQLVRKPIQLEFYKTLILFLLSVCIAEVILALFIYKLDLEKVFSLLALFLGFLYLITITPMSGPDEQVHYQSAYKLSNILLLQWDDSEYGNAADFDYSGFRGHYNVSSGYVRILEDIGAPSVAEDKIQYPGSGRTLSYVVEYLPQALGIAFARITNQNFVRIFLFGRLFNLLFYTGCLYFAVKRTPVFKTMFGLIGIMPMSLQQAASYSYDGFINGMSLLLIASILKAIYEDGLLSKADFYFMMVVGALLAPAKVIYFSIALLAVLIPYKKFGSKKKKIIGLTKLWMSGILLIVAFQLPSIFSLTVENYETLNWEGYHNYTLGFIFEHPYRTICIFWNTFQARALFWLRCAIGQVMSGLSLAIPSWIIDWYMIVIALSVLNQEKSEYVLQPLTRSCFLLVCMMIVFFTMLSMFLGWTSDFRTAIEGVQGRYFIPVIPLLALSLNNQIFILRKNIDRVLIAAAVLLQYSALTNVLNYTLLH